LKGAAEPRFICSRTASTQAAVAMRDYSNESVLLRSARENDAGSALSLRSAVRGLPKSQEHGRGPQSLAADPRFFFNLKEISEYLCGLQKSHAAILLSKFSISVQTEWLPQ
jgi:hypothetical protein